MNVEKIKAKVEVPFIQFTLPDFPNMQKDIIHCIEQEAVPNKWEINFPNAQRTPWHIIKHDSIKWLADQVTNTIGKWDKCKEGLLVCDEIWGVISDSESGSKSHSHYPATWSAVAYISCPEGSGNTVWPDIDKKVKPTDGNVCIFPGWLNHYVEASAANIKRIIVSCNIYKNKDMYGR
jgi:hypothetical protein|tara:strand:+ start:1814 stop:2347 length:534 start_codon:yes stop_codon:yes gene_type:complete